MNPEDNKNTADLTMPKNFLSNIFSSALFYLTILLFIIGFNFSDRMAGNWYQQFMPNLSNMPISDVIFLDSLNGYAITGDQTPNDTNYIIKTTSGGDTWNIVYRDYKNHLRVKFLNINTGFVCGGFNTSSGELIKTTNAGLNWLPLNTPGSIWYDDMALFGEDTIWLVQRSSLDGGVFRTTNGGSSWEQQFSGGTQNPNKIYMYNAMLGFMSNNSGSPNIYRTTNGGQNWNIFIPGKAFNDMIFTDSLKGWYCYDSVRITTNGGFNWQTQVLPYGGDFAINSAMLKFSQNDNDTIWGVGGYFDYGGNPNINRGVIYKSTNSGSTWGFQLPDTSFKIPRFRHISFVNSLKGWAYNSYFSQQSGGTISMGVHTTTGGDTTLFTGIQKISTEIPKQYSLSQNYPNPFNPRTVIPYKLKMAAYVRLIAYEVTGRETQILVNQYQQAGEYEVDFIGKFAVSSGVYFYRIEVTDDKTKQLFTETKKMILIK